MSKLQLGLFVFAFFTFLKPPGFDFLGYADINAFFNIARMIVAMIVIPAYLYKKRWTLSPLIRYECLFFLTLCIATIIRKEEEVSSCLIFVGSAISFTVLIELLMKQNVKLLINTLFICYFILIVVNLAYMITSYGFVINIEELLPEAFVYGSDIVISLLGSVNSTAGFMFPALASAVLLLISTSKKNLWAWTLIACIFISELFIWSATSLAGVFIIMCYILFVYKNKKLEKKISSTFVLFTGLAISIGITFFKIQYLFSYVIVNILKKDLSMTGRTRVWEIGWDGFHSSPLIGCGYRSTTIDNGYIQVLFNCGVIGFVAFSLLLLFIIRQCYKYPKSSLNKVFAVVMATVILMFTTESWPFFAGIYILFALSCHSAHIDSQLSAIKKSVKYAAVKTH